MHHWASFTHKLYAYEWRDDETKQIHKLQARLTAEIREMGKWCGNGNGNDNESVICDVQKEFCGVRQSTAALQLSEEEIPKNTRDFPAEIIKRVGRKCLGKIKSQVARAESVCVCELYEPLLASKCHCGEDIRRQMENSAKDFRRLLSGVFLPVCLRCFWFKQNGEKHKKKGGSTSKGLQRH